MRNLHIITPFTERNKGKMKETWRIVKEVIGIDTSEVGTCNGLKSDDSLISYQFEIGDHFNNYSQHKS